MKLEKIITLANEPVRLRFMALERSLRATGCDLPLWVIPYDDRRFNLPPNAIWWEIDEIRQWLRKEKTHPMMAKYQCLTEANYQYVDSDVVFLRDPAKALANETGFIASCGHWHNPGETITPESLEILKALSTCWQRTVFNGGQFASDRALYTFEELKRTCLDPRYVETCLRFRFHDQPGLVLLANLTGVPINNLTLPPTCMESTWAGDYAAESYENLWRDETRKPYLIHWAGCNMCEPRAIDKLFTQFLTAEEREEWENVGAKAQAASQPHRSLPQRLAHGLRLFASEVRK